MSDALLRFIDHHRQPLLMLYVAALVLVAAAFALAVWRGSRALGERPGQRLEWRLGLPPAAAVPMGLLFVLLILPWFVDNLGRYGRVWREDPGLLLFALLFVAAGLLLVGIGLRGWWRTVGVARELDLADVELRPGGLVSGRYRIAAAGAEAAPVRVHLVLQQTRLAPLRRAGRHLQEQALWLDSLEVRPRRRGDLLEVPFLFRLPARLPALREGQGRPEWVLVREGSTTGSSIHLVRAGRDAVSGWERAPRTRTGRMGRPAAAMPGGTAIAARGARSTPLQLAALAFVALFPWVFWFLLDSGRQPWRHLPEMLPPVLLAGAIAACLFWSAVFALLAWALADEPEGARWRRLRNVALTADGLIAGGAIVWLVRHGPPRLQGHLLDAAMEFFSVTVLHAIVGMFLWVSIWAAVQLLWSMVRAWR